MLVEQLFFDKGAFPFICGTMGEPDQNGMYDYFSICPAFGSDATYAKESDITMVTKAKTEKKYLEPILDEVRAERKYQSEKWGNFKDDTQNLPHHWASYIGQYSTNWMNGSWAPHTKETVESFRQSMIKSAAIALAAVESVDRQRAEGEKAFFEKT